MHIKMKNIKSIDLSCASPASTAICSSIDQHSMVKNGTKSLHRLNSYIGDQYRTITNNIYTHSPSNRAPCLSELPFTPRPSSFSYREKTIKLGSVVKHSDVVTRRRSSADVTDLKRYNNTIHKNSTNTYDHSSRYLLGESKFLDSLHQESEKSKKNDDVTNVTSKSRASVPSTPVFGEGRRSTSKIETRRFGSMLDAEKERQQIMKHFSLINVRDQREIRSEHQVIKLNGGTNYDGHGLSQKQKSMGYCKSDSLVQKTSSSARSRDQVVVLRVSLHCKGCAGKLRKHLSKMEGVTSFSIDLDTKKVTVIGSVTPLDVLTSISKVKNAQFWPSPASNSTTSSSSSSTSSYSTKDSN